MKKYKEPDKCCYKCKHVLSMEKTVWYPDWICSLHDCKGVNPYYCCDKFEEKEDKDK